MAQVNVTPEQIQSACQAGVKLLTNDERVNCPPSMAMNGELALVVGILTSLATGQAVLSNAPEADQAPANDGEGGTPPAED